MLENQYIEIRIRDHWLKAEQAEAWIQDEAIPRGPRMFACPAGLKVTGRGLDSHS